MQVAADVGRIDERRRGLEPGVAQLRRDEGEPERREQGLLVGRVRQRFERRDVRGRTGRPQQGGPEARRVGDDQLDRIDEIVAPVEKELAGFGEVIGMCVQLEAEAAQLDVFDRADDLDALGLGDGALPRFVRAAYHLLGLRTCLTTGEKESRAWTFRAGWKAPRCAGVIHGDLERGFIRAEVIHWDELLELGAWKKAKDLGKIRVEGKDYEVQDGDVLVCRMTNPAWVVLFTKVSGLVTDAGGTVSHPAVVSREFGIPAVVGTSDATHKIKTGDRVRVNGSSGVVEILA